MTPSSPQTLKVRWLTAMDQVEPKAWNALAHRLPSPFLEWEWLHLMEASGSIAPETGWHPRHLTVWQGRRLVGAAPLYIKDHSEGEFIYSYLWAQVAQKLAIPYYPYLVGMSPVTPVAGYRFLLASNTDPDVDSDTYPDSDGSPKRPASSDAIRGLDRTVFQHRIVQTMVTALEALCLREGLSGINLLFADPAWSREMAAMGFTLWQHQGYQWQNPGHRTFQDYLACFNANQRRNIKRERRRMAAQGIHLEMLAGDAITPAHLERMYRYYADTNNRYGPWGCKYLQPAFFQGLHQAFRDRVLLMAAQEANSGELPLAMALLIAKGDRLYGRYWGCTRQLDSLHFNVCYYGPLEWAIDHGIRIFDPGMGAHHKMRRGFVSVSVYSLHRFFNPVLQGIMDHHMDKINLATREQIVQLNRHIPYAKKDHP